jgi:transposase
VFYDVTTLYFESGIKGGLRDFGFSKEHRTQDTQVVVGLVVNQHGFPLYFDVFKWKNI